MFGIQILLLCGLSAAALSPEAAIDDAFALILQTQAGQAICTHILGRDPAALEAHLGVSPEGATRMAALCPREIAIPAWLHPTNPADIRKLTVENGAARKYQFVQSDKVYPIESWTDNFTNTTVILAETLPVSRSRLVQALAHEMAVYFDSKANPAQPDALKLPQMASLNLKPPTAMDPLVALSDPLTAHTLTFVRALQLERLILYELVNRGTIEPPTDSDNPYLAYLLSERCDKNCLGHLIVNMREDYLPLSLPLLAFAPNFRARALDELRSPKINWADAEVLRAQESLFKLPVDFLRRQTRGDSLANLRRLFDEKPEEKQDPDFVKVSAFLNYDLWPLEWAAINQTLLGTGEPLLEFMKKPLLSGYNVMLSSGPRVRVRTGNIE